MPRIFSTKSGAARTRGLPRLGACSSTSVGNTNGSEEKMSDDKNSKADTRRTVAGNACRVVRSHVARLSMDRDPLDQGKQWPTPIVRRNSGDTRRGEA